MIVSPRGSFLFLGFGSPVNLGIRAYDAALGLDFLLDDIPLDRRPIHVVAGGAPHHLLARDDHERINGLVVHPERAELVPLVAPRTHDREGVAAALARVPTLAPHLRDGLCRALDDTHQRVGMAMARRLIWAIVAAHARGHREVLALETEPLFQWFLDTDLLDAMPCERVRRESLRWIEARTGLVSRSRKGSPVWRVHFELLSRPTATFIAMIAP